MKKTTKFATRILFANLELEENMMLSYKTGKI